MTAIQQLRTERRAENLCGNHHDFTDASVNYVVHKATAASVIPSHNNEHAGGLTLCALSTTA